MHVCTCWRDFSNLGQSSYGIGNNHGGGVRDKILEQIKKSLVLDQLGVDVMQLSHTYCGSLANIRIIVLKGKT